MSNFDQFLKETIAQAKEEEEKAKSKANSIILGAYDGIINESPVDTGLFRSSNLITYNKTTDEAPNEPSEQRIERQKDIIDKVKYNSGDTITIQNNSVYGNRLEAGYSKQAPNGIYQPVEDRIQQILNKDIKV